MKATIPFTHIKIHWGEFCGHVERAEIDLPIDDSRETKEMAGYKYYVQLRGYKPFTLFKCIKTNQWMDNREIHSSISTHVIYYTKMFIDEYERNDAL